jgi:HEAT repeat protein
VTDFATKFKSLAEMVGGAAMGVRDRLDQWSFKMLVDQLKDNDFDVANSAIQQLSKEKKTIAIPPIYFVSCLHPNPYVRDRALKALKEFGQDDVIERLTSGKEPEEATKALIDHFGNYKR